MPSFAKVLRGLGLRIRHIAFWGWTVAARGGWRLGRLGLYSFVERADLISGWSNIDVGRWVFIGRRSRIEAIQRPGAPGPVLTIGDGTHVESDFHLGCAERVIIGRNVLIAGKVYITDHDHGLDMLEVPILEHPLVCSPVEIGDLAWLGEGVSVLKGVKIGKGAVVGAGSVVTKSIPDYAIAVGVPARVIGFRREGGVERVGT